MTGLRSRIYWGVWGNDLIGELRRSRPARQTSQHLAGAPPALFEGLRTLADVNVRRHEQMFRFIALGYLTLPLGATALAADIAPDFLQEIYDEATWSIWLLVLSLAGGVYVAFVGLWRARQILTTLELLAVEQSLDEPFPDQPSSRAAAGAK